jgi:four helix bundle protein
MRSDDAFKTGRDIRDRAFRFACLIVKFCERLNQAGGVATLMAPQLLNCGTALFPMLEEARAAESKRDFISKCSIGLKEIRETHGRLRIHEACNVGPVNEAMALRVEANELVAIVTTIVGNTRASAGIKPGRRRSPASYFKTIPNHPINS